MKKHKTTLRQIGIWMDHKEARFITPAASEDKPTIVRSPYLGRERIAGESGDGIRLGNYRSTNNESHKHFRRQSELNSYYKQLAGELLPFDEILIFGPANAHREFHNFLLKEKNFSKKNITVKKSDYITDNQIRKIVRTFFSADVKIQ